MLCTSFDPFPGGLGIGVIAGAAGGGGALVAAIVAYFLCVKKNKGGAGKVAPGGTSSTGEKPKEAWKSSSTA